MRDNNWKENAAKYKPLVNPVRKLIPLSKYPQDLDFAKTVGDTIYVVKSHFDKKANESLLRILSRLFSESKIYQNNCNHRAKALN